MTVVPKPAWLIFLASFVVYQANLRPVASLDSLPAALLPFSILLDGSLHLDRFAPYLMHGQPRTPYCLHEKNGHYYSTYSIAQPLLLTPLYVPVCAALSPASWEPGDLILLARMLEKLIAGTLAAASAAVFFVLLDGITSRRNALLLTAAYAFGTTTWAISSQALWQHSGGGLLIVLALLALQHWAADEQSPKFLLLAGLWSGLAVAVRPTDGLLACAIVIALLIKRTKIRLLGVFALPVIVCGCLTAAWNLWLFQDVRGYSAGAAGAQFLAGLTGILFSPGRGLLVYCPFLIFAAAGAVAWGKSLLLSVSAMFCLAHLALVSIVPEWWGGACWGPRLLTEMMPFLILLMLPAFDAVITSVWLRSVFACLLLYSVFVQFVGAFCYPNGRWDSTPPSANFSERVWNRTDNPIRRTIRAGLFLTPHEIVLEGALHGKAAAVRKMREMGMKGF